MNTVKNPFFGLIIHAKNDRSLLSLEPNVLEKEILEHGLVIFRGFLSMNNDEMSSFCRQFGDLLEWDFGHVLELQIRANPENHIFSQGRVELHWDGAFASAVPRFNFFQCIEGSAEAGGGETTFLNTVKFLESLPLDQISEFKKLTIRYETEKKAHYGGVIQTPLVSEHPITKELRMQFIEPFNEDNVEVNPVNTQIVGMEREKSDALLKQIVAFCYNSQFFYDHQWNKGDYLLVDNHANLHGRRRFQGQGLNRTLKRIHIL
ncbi:TauD/TfdA dioxygenase family protein [Aliikangiella sp. IMCC44359]|uniref:TauD/TfdA dioxygenase family protein n=1 Tax=Aliikangiella sp. IMCC44359 TaxID=3459125 RepID=UPI00403AA157